MGHEIRMRFAHIIFYVAKGDTYFGYALCTMHFALEKTHQRINFNKKTAVLFRSCGFFVS